MAYGVFLIVLLASVCIINSQQDYKYEHLQSELSALKKFVSNMNSELDKVRKMYDDEQEELRAVRGQQETHSRLSLSDKYDSYPRRNEEGEITHMNKRATAYIPTLHLSNVWNGTNAACAPKGEKGDMGLQGPKGDKGTTGPQGTKGDIGQKGSAGAKGSEGHIGVPGPKGNTGIQGARGQKGDLWQTGITGPMGPKGTKGNTGIGQKGNTGNPGARGHKGREGRPGTTSCQVQKVSFSVEKKIQTRRHDMQIKFDKVYWNDGSDFSRSTGVFTCRVPGVYLFTLNAIVPPGHEMEFVIIGSNQEWRHLAVYGSTLRKSGSVTALLQLSLGEKIWVQRRNATRSANAICNFEGVLLY